MSTIWFRVSVSNMTSAWPKTMVTGRSRRWHSQWATVLTEVLHTPHSAESRTDAKRLLWSSRGFAKSGAFCSDSHSRVHTSEENLFPVVSNVMKIMWWWRINSEKKALQSRENDTITPVQNQPGGGKEETPFQMCYLCNMKNSFAWIFSLSICVFEWWAKSPRWEYEKKMKGVQKYITKNVFSW